MSENNYNYYDSARRNSQRFRLSREKAADMGRARIRPSLRDPDYLSLRERRKLFARWIGTLKERVPLVLDIGGRLQPYRPMIEDRVARYVAIDPIREGLADVVAVGERLPFRDATFDAAICTQVLTYANSPGQFVSEIYRVMKPGAGLFLTAPAFFPQHHDERWRFLPDGLAILMSHFSRVEILPEGHSITGLCRTINICQNIYVKNEWVHKVLTITTIPIMNIYGLMLDALSRGNDQLTANFAVMATK